MQKPLDVLLSLFPTGTTEGEKHLLNRAFVQAEEFRDFVTPPPGSPRILVGRKGSGKSAVLEFADSYLRSGKVRTLSLKPFDIDMPIPTDESVGATTRAAYAGIMRAVAGNVGSTLKGMLSRNDKRLYDEAVQSGLVTRDAVEQLAEYLPRLAQSTIGADAKLPQASRATSEGLRDALNATFKQTAGAFYLFLDDTDQIAAPAQKGHLNRVWALLLAVRALTQRVPSLRAVISVREEVWRRLLYDGAGQRDQADHFIPLVRYVVPTREHVRAIVERRLTLAAIDMGQSRARTPYHPFFEGDQARMPSSEEKRSWDDLIVLRARERPRDAIQLVNALAMHAKARGAALVGEKDLDAVMPEFSAQRANLLAQEIEVECPQIREVVRSLADVAFDQGSFKSTAEVLRQHFRRLPSESKIELFGRAMQPDNDDDAFELWRLLYEVGVVNARRADISMKDGYRHIFPKDEPGLVSRARWNEMQGIVWEVNPAYRDYLIKIQVDESRRIGLPPRRVTRGRR